MSDMVFSIQYGAKSAPGVHKAGLDGPRRNVERDGDFAHAQIFEIEKRQGGSLNRWQRQDRGS